MKQFITIAILFISINVFGQQFDGVNISGDLPTAIAKYKGRGYTFEKFIDYSKEENENDIKRINQLQAKLNLTYKNN
jgi:hypothetical protein